MPSEFSLYKKIQVVLETARAVDVTSLAELNAEILSQRPPNFLTKQYDKKHDTFVHEVSKRGVRKATNICRMLLLIDDKGHMTDVGRRAQRSAGFNRVLAAQVQGFLASEGVEIAMLASVMHKSLRSDPLIMPTSDVLWEKTGSKTSLLLFSQMLTLLAQCGRIKSFQRKIYLELVS